jgi:hypothetical protein
MFKLICIYCRRVQLTILLFLPSWLKRNIVPSVMTQAELNLYRLMQRYRSGLLFERRSFRVSVIASDILRFLVISLDNCGIAPSIQQLFNSLHTSCHAYGSPYRLRQLQGKNYRRILGLYVQTVTKKGNYFLNICTNCVLLFGSFESPKIYISSVQVCFIWTIIWHGGTR